MTLLAALRCYLEGEGPEREQCSPRCWSLAHFPRDSGVRLGVSHTMATPVAHFPLKQPLPCSLQPAALQQPAAPAWSTVSPWPCFFSAGWPAWSAVHCLTGLVVLIYFSLIPWFQSSMQFDFPVLLVVS